MSKETQETIEFGVKLGTLATLLFIAYVASDIGYKLSYLYGHFLY